jgi:hypothetical protein
MLNKGAKDIRPLKSLDKAPGEVILQEKKHVQSRDQLKKELEELIDSNS